MSGPYAGFVLSAYGVSLIAFAGLALWLILDARHQRRAIADLESRGIRRRSAITTTTSTETRS